MARCSNLAWVFVHLLVTSPFLHSANVPPPFASSPDHGNLANAHEDERSRTPAASDRLTLVRTDLDLDGDPPLSPAWHDDDVAAPRASAKVTTIDVSGYEASLPCLKDASAVFRSFLGLDRITAAIGNEHGLTDDEGRRVADTLRATPACGPLLSLPRFDPTLVKRTFFTKTRTKPSKLSQITSCNGTPCNTNAISQMQYFQTAAVALSCLASQFNCCLCAVIMGVQFGSILEGQQTSTTDSSASTSTGTTSSTVSTTLSTTTNAG